MLYILSVLKSSLHELNITLASLSVQTKVPINIRPSVISIFIDLLIQLISFIFRDSFGFSVADCGIFDESPLALSRSEICESCQNKEIVEQIYRFYTQIARKLVKIIRLAKNYKILLTISVCVIII